MKKQLLLRELRSNARHPITSISRKEKIPVTTLYAALKNLEGSVIRKYSSLLGPASKLSRELLLVETRNGSQEIRNLLRESPAVNNLYRTQKGFTAQVFTRNRKEKKRIKKFLEEHNAVFSFHELKEPLAEEIFVPE